MTAEMPLTREAILDAAEQVLRRYGPEKTSVVDIAKFLQVSHGSLYRHFPSKAALREAVTERWLYNSILLPLREVAEKREGSAEEGLRLWFETLISYKRKYAVEEPEMFAMYAAVTLEAEELIRVHIDGLVSQIQSILEYGVDKKEFRPGNEACLVFSDEQLPPSRSRAGMEGPGDRQSFRRRMASACVRFKVSYFEDLIFSEAGAVSLSPPVKEIRLRERRARAKRPRGTGRLPSNAPGIVPGSRAVASGRFRFQHLLQYRHNQPMIPIPA